MRLRTTRVYKSSKQKMDTRRRKAKRKNACQDFIFELDENDMSPEHVDSDASEPDTKIFKSEVNSQRSDNLDSGISQVSVQNSENLNRTDDEKSVNGNCEETLICTQNSENISENAFSQDSGISCLQSTQENFVNGRKDSQTILPDIETDCEILYMCTEGSQTESETCTREKLVRQSLDSNLKVDTIIHERQTRVSINVDESDGGNESFVINTIERDEVKTTEETTRDLKGDLLDKTITPETYEPCISIKFKDKSMSELYKMKFIRFLQNFIEFEIDCGDVLSINVCRDALLDAKEWVVVDEVETAKEIQEAENENKIVVSTPSKKKKKKNKKNKDMFVVDTTPSISINAPSTMYSSKFLIEKEEEKKESVEALKSSASCFNCDGDHSMKDCPEPKDHGRINAARRQFRDKFKTSRYHIEEDQKYSHLKPGKISENLRKALGLRKWETPPYIYHMRIIGYPPGWLEEAKIVNSELEMFDIDGNNVKGALPKKKGLDSDKIIEYPGFNVPFEKGYKDECRHYRVPPYSEKFNKNVMIDYFKKQISKEEDNFETCDMDLDTTNTSEIEPVETIEISDTSLVIEDKQLSKVLEQDKKRRDSPSLVELEIRKEQLLAALDDSSISVKLNETVEDPSDKDTTINQDESINEESKKDGEVKSSETKEETADEDKESDNLELTPTRENLNIVKTSLFGTPILKSKSPYSRLPNPDNFSKGVSPVINFENLPNSTGKYEQMTGVLQKVRNLKNLQKCKS